MNSSLPIPPTEGQTLERPRICTAWSDRFLCQCLQVTENTVMEAIMSLDIRSIAELRQHTGAGDGCTACHRKLHKYIEQYAQACAPASPICSVK